MQGFVDTVNLCSTRHCSAIFPIAFGKIRSVRAFQGDTLIVVRRVTFSSKNCVKLDLDNDFGMRRTSEDDLALLTSSLLRFSEVAVAPADIIILGCGCAGSERLDLRLCKRIGCNRVFGFSGTAGADWEPLWRYANSVVNRLCGLG